MIIIHGMNNYHAPLGRCLIPVVRTALSHAPVVVLTGACQTGKTTLVSDILGKDRIYVTLDDMETADRAEREPDALLDTSKPLTIGSTVMSEPIWSAICRCSRSSNTWWTSAASCASPHCAPRS